MVVKYSFLGILLLNYCRGVYMHPSANMANSFSQRSDHFPFVKNVFVFHQEFWVRNDFLANFLAFMHFKGALPPTHKHTNTHRQMT